MPNSQDFLILGDWLGIVCSRVVYGVNFYYSHKYDHGEKWTRALNYLKIKFVEN